MKMEKINPAGHAAPLNPNAEGFCFKRRETQ